MNTPLDPETSRRLQPVIDDGEQAIRQRDTYNAWTVDLARILGISCSGFESEEIPKQYAELRGRITEAVKALKA